jgi:rubredoxin
LPDKFGITGFFCLDVNIVFCWRSLMKKWQCLVCGFIYDEAEGMPEEGIAAGTSWDDIPDDWMCPDCGVGKNDFEMVEITDVA